jgi:hypothetical protein
VSCDESRANTGFLNVFRAARVASGLQRRENGIIMSAMRAAIRLPLLVLLLAPTPAFAVTLDQIVALSRAGVSDTVIIALIDRDKAVISVEPEQLPKLQQDGVSEAVLLAMLKSGRDEAAAAQAADAAMNAAFYSAYSASYDTYPQVASVGQGSEESGPPRRSAVRDPDAAVVQTYLLPYAVPQPVRSRCATALPAAPPAAAAQVATSTRGIFFMPPATSAPGQFFNPQLAAAPVCQHAVPAAHRR